jgi:helix-turn-helix, Psq domain
VVKHVNVKHPQAGHTQNAACYLATASMATPQQQEALFREDRIDLAIQAHKQGQIPSFRAATTIYDVPRSTA